MSTNVAPAATVTVSAIQEQYQEVMGGADAQPATHEPSQTSCLGPAGECQAQETPWFLRRFGSAHTQRCENPDMVTCALPDCQQLNRCKLAAQTPSEEVQ